VRTSARLGTIGVVLAAVVGAFLLRGASRPTANVMESESVAEAPVAGAPAAGAPATAPAPLPRLVDLGRGTCIPCKMMAPILEELAEEFADKLTVEVIDLRELPGAARRYGIRVIPTQIFYDASGTERFRHEGFMSREAILAKWSELGVELEARPGARNGANTSSVEGEAR
jgi:thioredoxin 1